MRYTSAVVLSTLAVGQAAAAHNRHASFHARREASKRDMNAVDWNALSYDLSDVDWDKVFSKTPAAVAQPTPTPVQEQPKPVAASPTPEAKKEAVTAAAVSSPKPAESSKAAEPSKGLIGDIIEDVGDLLAGVASVGAAIDAKMGINDKKSNGGLWLGKDSDWGMEVTNTGADAVYYCWVKTGFEGMLLNVNAPAISVMIKSGKTVSISAAPGISGACAPATSSLGKSSFGGVKNTWAEFTYGDPSIKKVGAFNVSKNVNMKGCSITMKGKSCTSNDNQCVFECQDKSADSCTYGYELRNCSAENGGGGGWDPVMAGTGGGCNMPEKGERLEISFS